jgi:branched-chain amino acid transport system substrate-binding protein
MLRTVRFLCLFPLIISSSCALVRPQPITVAIITKTKSGSIVGSSEINSFELYLQRNPNTRIRMRVIDDEWDPVIARREILRAKAESVQFFITSHPSSSAIELLDLFEDGSSLGLVTASTSDVLSGRDDFLLRVVADVTLEQKAIARHVAALPGKRILVVRDTGNDAYTQPALRTFESAIAAAGGREVRVCALKIAEFDQAVLMEAFRKPYDILYILAGSYQTAIGNIAQLSHVTRPGLPILLTPWARTKAIVDAAGPAAQYIILASQYQSRYRDAKVGEFYRRYRDRFGYMPASMSIGVYQSLELLDKAFATGNTDPASVKQFLLKSGPFETETGPVSFDQFGDISVPFHFITTMQKEFE